MKPMDIEHLLRWTYREELCKGGDIISSSFGIVIRLGQLGTIVDDQFGSNNKLPPIFGEPHPDAFVVDRYARQLPYPASPLVIGNASAGTRPHWYPNPIKVLPIRDGSRVRIVGECRGKDRYTLGSYCPLKFDPPLATVAHARAEYGVWFGALVHLAVVLQLQLSEHVATYPAASSKPWQTPDAVPHVLYNTAQEPAGRSIAPFKRYEPKW